jgi:ABC-type amino acid transport substrate-binding protein
MKKGMAFLSVLILLSLVATACGPTPPPTEAPATQVPTEAAMPEPTAAPTEEPTAVPTEEPTAVPTEEPTVAPTEEPTAAPTSAPPIAEAPKTLRLPDLEGRTVVAVTGNDYTPLNFVDPVSGESVGWEYDAVNEICRRLNCQVDWEVTAWDTMIAAVREGQFDVGMDGITITDERKEQVDFSDPYMVSQQFMLVRADEDRFTTPEEFAADEELLIGSQTGTTNFYVAVYEVLDGDEANPRIKLFENFGAAVQALIAGDVDMVLMDAASSRGYIGANPEKLKLVGDPLGTEEFGFIFTPGSDLVAPFNAAIAQMKADGYLDYLNTRWFFLTDPNAEDIYDQLADLDGRTVVAVTGNDYTPLNFVDPLSGEAVGWEYDAVNEICRRLNCQVDWEVTAWDTMIAAVREGQFDVGMDGITITDERKEQVDFSDPYMVSQQFMLVRADEDRFTTPEEFAADEELLIGSQTGTTNFYVAVYEVLDGDEANPRIKLFENFGAAVQALIAGDVDMVLMDAASSRGYIGANPEKLKLVGDPLGTEEFGFIFTPGSDLVAPFNAAIATMDQDGFLEHLNTRWFFLYDPTAE